MKGQQPGEPSPASPAATREAIRAHVRGDEAREVALLLAGTLLAPERMQAAREQARGLVARLREQRSRGSGVDALMREFSLSSQEGVALMCLAEALARIPDRATADALIRDKLAQGDWRAHLGSSGSLFVNAAAWGLMITGRLVATHSEGGLSAAVTRLLARGGEPLIRSGVDLAMRLLGQQFVLGSTIEAALERSREAQSRGYLYSYDMLGEAALTATDARRYMDSYAAAIEAIGASAPAAGAGVHQRPGISVKLSALHPRYSFSQRERVRTELHARLLELCRLARRHEIGLNIDAEESERLEPNLDLVELLCAEPILRDWEGLGVVVQAYQKRAPAVVDHLGALARASGRRMMVRLVKGAYWDSEIKRAQVEGLEGFPVFTRKIHTDASYLACAHRLLGHADRIYSQFATHNALTLCCVLQMTRAARVERFELQCLHGMGESLYDMVVGPERLGVACRIYAPVGSHETLLAYLVRRLLENGANSSFVNRILDETVGIDELLVDPLAASARTGGTPHPAIAAPSALFAPVRANSRGIDLADPATVERLLEAFARARDIERVARPVLAGGADADAQPPEPVRNPARLQQVIGHVRAASLSEVSRAFGAACASTWGARPPQERAAVLVAAAERLESDRDNLMWLAVHEAGKSLGDAAGEVREAVDFCRYYAARLQAGPGEGGTRGEPPGVAVAISPWNFPLAIFTGQVVAALAAGAAVLAKPAEQTPLIAARAVKLLHDAGVPPDALQLLPGDGRIGEALTRCAPLGAVLFTGSTEVAQGIDRVLAQEPRNAGTVLVAETGGLNAMIVDSSALPEQVVQDAVHSAFNSAGQRCSALRILCLQEEIAPVVEPMLAGAIAELRVGDPARLETDLGPVIDAQALEAIERHIAGFPPRQVLARASLAPESASGHFLAPALLSIASLAEVPREVFGPVLHVLRYRREELPALVDAINGTGYGLTFGVHSRIDETIDMLGGRIRAGNVYVNRNLIGAVVGVQPFGGEGLSGTGPKAGGPWMVPRLRRGARLRLASLDGARRTGEMAPACARFISWLQAGGDEALAARCEELAQWSPFGWEVGLPGPTGESNLLRYRPRGRVLCRVAGVADGSGHRAALLEQLAACILTGNRAVFEEGEVARELASRVPQEVADRIDWTANPAGEDLGAVLLRAPAGELAALRRVLAARDGARVAIVRDGGEGPPGYELEKLVSEQVVSVNTAAAGGNASLMTLSPD